MKYVPLRASERPPTLLYLTAASWDFLSWLRVPLPQRAPSLRARAALPSVTTGTVTRSPLVTLVPERPREPSAAAPGGCAGPAAWASPRLSSAQLTVRWKPKVPSRSLRDPY